MTVRRFQLPSGKTVRIDSYEPRRHKRVPTPHFDRLAELCDDHGWHLALGRTGCGRLLLWVEDGGRYLASCRVDSRPEMAARAVLRAL